jgi:hypothetical protein
MHRIKWGGGDYRRGLDWMIGFIALINSRLLTTTHYRASVNLHNTPQHLVSLFQPAVFISRFLATASNIADSSASRAQVLPSLTLVQNCPQLNYSAELNCTH